MARPDVVIVSNRGPLSFKRDGDGSLVVTRGAGGLVSSLGPAVAGSDATWISTAVSDADREATAQGTVEAEGFRLRPVAVERDLYKQYYDVVANATLWFMHHNLFDLPRRPWIDRRWRDAWHGFCQVNRSFAEVVADEAVEGAVVLVHDYHLPLVGGFVSSLRPDLRCVHFNHIPFCDPTALGSIPDDVAVDLLGGLGRHVACGFQSRRWAASFEACCHARGVAVPPTFVAPAATSADDLRSVATSPACAEELSRLDEQVGERSLIVRVDRIELSKNILRGFLAFEELLRAQPAWRGRVVFAAFVYPSRIELADYLAYRSEVEGLVERINNTWATSSWTPILLDTSDSFVRSVAALRRYDVLLVNPVRDGLNLVAKEGPIVNDRNGVVALSREAGVWDEVGEACLGVNPFDLVATADALASGLTMAGDERAERAGRLRALAIEGSPSDWLQRQLAAAGPAR
ncbi:MAG TPA: trehalose-6-phosphate synthase [Acidimicrobiales bacterium]|nr:trehalose-6-phosphate synthase [Acidimicrobiales bacterium]